MKLFKDSENYIIVSLILLCISGIITVLKEGFSVYKLEQILPMVAVAFLGLYIIEKSESKK